jgi:hypothetical protein
VANTKELTLEERITRIERALVVHGLIERDMPAPKAVSNPQAVARNILWFPLTDGVNYRSFLLTFDCSHCGKAHRVAQSMPTDWVWHSKSEYFPVRCDAGHMTDVLIEKS